VTLERETRPARGWRRESLEPIGPDWLVAGVAALGVLIAAYLTFAKWSGGGALFCSAGSSCDLVQASVYSRFLGLPTALWGAVLYAVVAGLALSPPSPRRWRVAFLVAAAGAAFSLYLTAVSAFVLRALCGYCLASNAVALTLAALLLARYPAPSGWRPATRLARMLVLGSVTGLAIVLVAGGYFAWRPAETGEIYRHTLASHLASTGAVFYGSFW